MAKKIKRMGKPLKNCNGIIKQTRPANFLLVGRIRAKEIECVEKS